MCVDGEHHQCQLELVDCARLIVNFRWKGGSGAEKPAISTKWYNLGLGPKLL